MREATVACKSTIADLPVDGVDQGLAEWLLAQTQKYRLEWLLAHADDGVIWGRVRDNSLHLSSGAAPTISPPLRSATLQMARLFGPSAELTLWREEQEWHARLIDDSGSHEGRHLPERFDEQHMLWGTSGRSLGESGFVIWSDGAQGLRHVVPLPDAGDRGRTRPLRLQVRQYVAEDNNGFARVVANRLVSVTVQEQRA